ncbi:MAG: glycosyltransferase family 39 protein [Anaerolineales bacterium]|nr:glycosyltransferase family 39 protein [Anaerolineales bacterium]
MEQDKNTPKNSEPTVLDLYKSATKDWASFFNFIQTAWNARRREEFNQALAQETAQPVIVERTEDPIRSDTFPYRTALAFFLALIAQALVEPPLRLSMISVVIYLAAFGVAFWSYQANEWRLPALPPAWQVKDPPSMRLIPLVLSVFFGATAFVLFDGNLFSWTNITLWLISIGLLVYSLRVNTNHQEISTTPLTGNRKWLWYGLILAVFGLVAFYRFYQIDTLPNEPFSDHAEKLLDVYDITQGEPHIFFERNTGREAIQFYWTVMLMTILNTGISFLSLKIGTVLLGFLTVPFIFMLGKEYGNDRVALYALFLFGVASWPNIISRIGLRFPLYPLFLAPTLLYLTRGLRTRNRNDIILAGIFLGLGLHGYSPFRIVPVFVAVIFLIYFLHTRSLENRQQTIFWFLIVVIVSAFVFSPLLRYWLSRPDLVNYRALTRMSGVEQALPGPAWQIFLSNLYNGMLMFNWDDGSVWVNSVVHRPALDVITAALFAIGFVFLIVRYIRQRDWRDLVLLVSLPILMQPSVLSLAYPNENPELNRAGGAAVTSILIGAMALDGLVTSFGSGLKRKIIAYGMVVVLFAGVAYSNYDIVFHQFKDVYDRSTWNSKDMGKVISEFRDTYGQTDTVWIVPFPYWVDTRLPGINAGIPNRDFALWQDQLPESLNIPAPKLFMFKDEDTETERILRELYPNGKLTLYTSPIPGKNFYVYLVEK